jgi:uncharacterized membrane protein YoaK (UPF0700 family)
MADISRTVLVGGFVLTLISGMVNAVGFLSFAHQGLTHLTGITTHISIYLSSNQLDGVLHAFALVLSFVIGSIVSSFVIQKSNLKLGRNYGFVLILEGFLFFSAIYFLNKTSIFGEYIVASACGLQNAMATTYAGSILRTTHLTGVFTDLGIWIGHYLRKLTVDPFAIKIYIVLIVGFISGGVLGVFLFSRFEYFALLFPGAVLVITGVSYIYFASLNQENS